MNPQTAPLFDTPQIRAFLAAARELGLPIGNMPPLHALNYITAEGHSVAVSRKAREMYPEAFEKQAQ